MKSETPEIERINLKIGPYQICPLYTGFFGLDGGAMFGTIPKVLWESTNPGDSNNRIKMQSRPLLLKSDQHNILIDAGNGHFFKEKYGEKLGNKFAERFAIESDEDTLKDSLFKFGLSTDDIHTVILTHLHFDHVGGGTTYKNNSTIPTFPNAKYFVQKSNLAAAQTPHFLEKASYLSANYQPLLDAHVLETVTGSTENFFPNISLIETNGHTQGQQLVKVSDEKNTLLFCADLIPTSSHVKLAWIMGYDLDKNTQLKEKQKILELAEQQKWFLFLEHDPEIDAIKVTQRGQDFAVLSRYNFGNF